MSIRKMLLGVAAVFLIGPAFANTSAIPARSANQVQTASAKVDINTATAQQLETVKGIGPKRAAAIVAYRNKNGKFSSLDQLTNVKEIGAKFLAKIKNKFTLGSA